ncbi:hypothetical protein V491_04295, partial [Pseudogymnoascus sp. VKM F-3775]
DADQDEAFVDPEQINLVKRVSTKAPFHVPSPKGDMHVAVIDCGVKENILRSLVSRGASVTTPSNTSKYEKISQALLTGFPSQGDLDILVKAGSGITVFCHQVNVKLRSQLVREGLQDEVKICLGHQLLALAAGGRTIKLKYGNRAHNIPALDRTTGQCHITSQNHGYAVDTSTLPDYFKEYFVNLNDGSNEGMIHTTRPIFSTQFHPEAKGGPMDSSYLFDMYLENVRRYKDGKKVVGAVIEDKISPLLVDILAKERVGVEPAQEAAAAAAAA